MSADGSIRPGDGSVSRLISGLKEGDQAAVQALWERFFQPLVRLTGRRVPSHLRRQAGPEDIAVEAFLDFCACLARPDAGQRFPRLHDRTHLWKLLVCFTVRAALDFNKKAARRQRIVGGESVLGELGLAGLVGREPVPEFAAAVADLLEPLPDETLRQVALYTMEGYTQEEIARRMGCSVKTVERKARVIRSLAPDSDLEWICLKCLRREAAERFKSAEELADALRRFQERKRVRPIETAAQKVRRWLGPLARPPVDPDYIDRWRVCLRVEAATSFVAHAGMFFLTRLHPAGAWLWLWLLLTDMGVGWLIWLPLQRRRRLSLMEENLAQLWSAADVAAVMLLALFCPFLAPATPEAVGRFYMAYAVLRGLLFIIEGRMCWGRLYLVGPVFYAGAVVMRLLPEYAPLLHGTMYSAWFVWLSFRRWKTA